jgi:polyribonucleotide nucleotidyltransferase
MSCSAPSCSATRASSRSSTRSSSSPKPPPRSRATSAAPDHSELEAEMLGMCEADLRAAYKNTDKAERYAAIDAVKARSRSTSHRKRAKSPASRPKSSGRLQVAEAKVVRGAILETKSRIDGRDLSRSARSSRSRLLPRTHGSALFTRGETQAIVVPRSAPATTSSIVDSLEGTYKANFMLHYNFPPYSVGETGRTGSPAAAKSATASSHGAPSTRCCRSAEQFPYTIRVVSEITESNGSSSMARSAAPRWP